ncbi:hypothetical protein P9112_014569 [Eukaryota sp. TZLM1-RC]
MPKLLFSYHSDSMTLVPIKVGDKEVVVGEGITVSSAVMAVCPVNLTFTELLVVMSSSVDFVKISNFFQPDLPQFSLLKSSCKFNGPPLTSLVKVPSVGFTNDFIFGLNGDNLVVYEFKNNEYHLIYSFDPLKNKKIKHKKANLGVSSFEIFPFNELDLNRSSVNNSNQSVLIAILTSEGRLALYCLTLQEKSCKVSIRSIISHGSFPSTCICVGNICNKDLAFVGALDGTIIGKDLKNGNVLFKIQPFSIPCQIRQIEFTPYGLFFALWRLNERKNEYENYIGFIYFDDHLNYGYTLFKSETINSNLRNFSLGFNGRLLLLTFKDSDPEIFDLFRRSNIDDFGLSNDQFVKPTIGNSLKKSKFFSPFKLEINTLPSQVVTSVFDKERIVLSLIDGSIFLINVEIDMNLFESEFKLSKPIRILIQLPDILSALSLNWPELVGGDVNGNCHIINLESKSITPIPSKGQNQSITKSIRVKRGHDDSDECILATLADGTVTVITVDQIKKKSINDNHNQSNDVMVNDILPATIAKVPRAADVRIFNNSAVLLAVDSSIRVVPYSLKAVHPRPINKGQNCHVIGLTFSEKLLLRMTLTLLLCVNNDIESNVQTEILDDVVVDLFSPNFQVVRAKRITFEGISFTIPSTLSQQNSEVKAFLLVSVILGDFWSAFFAYYAMCCLNGMEMPTAFNNSFVNPPHVISRHVQSINYFSSLIDQLSEAAQNESAFQSIILSDFDTAIEFTKSQTSFAQVSFGFAAILGSKMEIQSESNPLITDFLANLAKSKDVLLSVASLCAIKEIERAFSLLVEHEMYDLALILAHKHSDSCPGLFSKIWPRLTSFWTNKFPLLSSSYLFFSKNWHEIAKELNSAGHFHLSSCILNSFNQSNQSNDSESNLLDIVQETNLFTGSIAHQSCNFKPLSKYFWQLAGSEGLDLLDKIE